MDKPDSESVLLRTMGVFEDFGSPFIFEVIGLACCGLWERDVDGTGAVEEPDWNDGRASST